MTRGDSARRRRAFALVCGVVLVRGAHVVAQPFSIGASSARAALPQIEIMTSTIFSTPTPGEQGSLLQALNRIDDLLGQLARAKAAIEARHVTVADFDRMSSELKSALAALSPQDCVSPSVAEAAVGKILKPARMISSLGIDTSSLDDIVGEPYDKHPSCAALVRDKARLDAALQPIRSELTKSEDERLADSRREAELTKKLLDKKNELTKVLEAISGRQSVSSNLWKILLVVGLLSLAVMVSIRLFAAEIQFEWVRSGQVIQFVTVMVLLSVIMALGLTETLKENTLGTLLGGIAGYVLSQGVGKAAAQEVARQARDSSR